MRHAGGVRTVLEQCSRQGSRRGGAGCGRAAEYADSCQKHDVPHEEHRPWQERIRAPGERAVREDELYTLACLYDPFDFTAAYFSTGISGGLGGEVVRVFVYDDRSSYDFRDRKPLIIENRKGISLIAEQGRHITGMVRVLCILRVIVHSRMVEVIAAVSSLVYVHGIEAARVGKISMRKPEDLCFHQYTAVGGIVEFNHAA